MKALISPEENNRIAEVAMQSFEIAQPLYWVGCADDVTTEWAYVDGIFIPPVSTAEVNKATAVSLLQQTDWVELPSVSNPQISKPYLANQAEFIAYRNSVRQYAVYPIAGTIDWAQVPQEVWETV